MPENDRGPGSFETLFTQGLSLIHGDKTDHNKIDLLNKRHIYVRVCVNVHNVHICECT